MAKTNEKITVRFTIDFFDQKIIGTKASFNKAAKGFGSEYEELAAKMAAHPDFELVVKEQKHKSIKAKRTYEGLDFPFMEAYILTQSDSNALMAEYHSVKAMAKSCGSNVYALTKKWFLDTFATEDEPFDMSKAREAINAYRIQKAVEKASESSNPPAQQEEKDEA